MRRLLEGFGRVANILLGLFVAGLGLLGWIHGGDMFVPLVPVGPGGAATALACAGAFAVAASVLAFRDGRWMRLPLLIWSALLVLVLVGAVFGGSYRFDGSDAFLRHGLLTLGALILLGLSWLGFRSTGKRGAMTHLVSGRFGGAGRLR